MFLLVFFAILGPLSSPSASAASLLHECESRLNDSRHLTDKAILWKFLRAVKFEHILSETEIREHVREYQATRSKVAADKIIRSVGRLLTIEVTRRRVPRGTSAADMLQEGVFGVLDAALHFDFRKESKFANYALDYAKYKMLGVIGEKNAVKVGRSTLKKAVVDHDPLKRTQWHAIKAVKSRLKTDATVQQLPDFDVVAKDTQMPREVVETLFTQLNYKQFETDDLRDRNSVQEDEIIAALDLPKISKVLSEFRESLSPAEKLIWDHRLVAEEPESLENLGARLGISRESARSIQVRMLDRLRDFLRNELDGEVPLFPEFSPIEIDEIYR